MANGPTTIIVIRHAEKPGSYGDTVYNGVNPTATACGAAGAKDLTTTGWQRAGGLVTLFGPAPFGPRAGLVCAGLSLRGRSGREAGGARRR